LLTARKGEENKRCIFGIPYSILAGDTAFFGPLSDTTGDTASCQYHCVSLPQDSVVARVTLSMDMLVTQNGHDLNCIFPTQLLYADMQYEVHAHHRVLSISNGQRVGIPASNGLDLECIKFVDAHT